MFELAQRAQSHIKCAVWGDLKTGKTRLALGFPKPAVIDAGQGVLPYAHQYQIHREAVTRWDQLEKPVAWLQANPGVYETLVLDDFTPLYQDLISQVRRAVKQYKGRDYLTYGDWGVIKDRLKSFLRLLIELPMHIVVTIRGKDQYEEGSNREGEPTRKKTGELQIDADKAIEYDMDLILQAFVETPKKAKTAADAHYKLRVLGTRYPELPLYTVYDVTRQSAYAVLFSDLERRLKEGAAAPAAAPTVSPAELNPEREIAGLPDKAKPVAPGAFPEATTAVNAAPKTEAERRQELDAFTAAIADGTPSPLPEQHEPVVIPEEGQPDPSRIGGRLQGPAATKDDLAVLFATAAKVTWPDGSKLKGSDAKALIKELYGVDSASDLTKPEVDFLHDSFTKVLAGEASLALDSEGVPYINLTATVNH